MSYTKNEVALETLISNINNQFYYIGEEDDKVAPIDVKKFTEHCVSFIDSLEIEMTKEMLFLCDVYTNWCDSQNLPNFYSADDLCYGRDTKDKLTLKQKNWLETFIDVWDFINQNT